MDRNTVTGFSGQCSATHPEYPEPIESFVPHFGREVGLGDALHLSGMRDNSITRNTPRSELFAVCGYHNWNDSVERRAFTDRVKSAISNIFDTSKTWFHYSRKEKEDCVTRFLSALSIPYIPQVRTLLIVISIQNDRRRIHEVCVAYLKQRCDNLVKYKRNLLSQDDPQVGQDDGQQRLPIPPKPGAPVDLLMISPVISPNVAVPQYDLPQEYFRIKFGGLIFNQI